MFTPAKKKRRIRQDELSADEVRVDIFDSPTHVSVDLLTAGPAATENIPPEETSSSPEHITRVYEPLYHQARQMQIGKVRVPGTGDLIEVQLRPHPTNIVEPKSLMATPLPEQTYYPCLPAAVFETGRLSAAQYETISYAGQRHETFVRDGNDVPSYRCGYFLGDGTGLGKGRQIAGVIADNWLQGRKRALWISCSRDLAKAAQADFSDLQLGFEIPFFILDSQKGLKWGNMERQIGGDGCGVIFATYASLSIIKREDHKRRRRLEDLVEWINGSDGGEMECGVVAFDETHKAKNLQPTDGSVATATGLAVQDIQTACPFARIFYASATGISRPEAFAPFARLGIWGSDSCPFRTFSDALDVIQPRNSRRADGLARMELISRELKASGLYMSRSLAFSGCSFTTVHINMPTELRAGYNLACDFWREVFAFHERVVKRLEDMDDRDVSAIIHRVMFGYHLRFFKAMMMSSKLPYVIAAAKKAMEDGFSPIIAMWSTGGSGLAEAMEQSKESAILNPEEEWFESEVSSIISAPRQSLMKFLDHYDGEKSERMRQSNFVQLSDIEDNGYEDHKRELAVLKEKLKGLILPGNPLDVLIHELGGPESVAEMSGRTQRQEYDYELGRFRTVERSQTNNDERDAFMDGKKLCCIITGAASAGISLHADRARRNQRQRIMFVIELTWAADSTLQQFGRVHRSNQASAPIYKMVVSSLGGEARFVGSITARLKKLGALTRGDRGAAVGDGDGVAEFAEKSFFDKYGALALKKCAQSWFDVMTEAGDPIPEPKPPCIFDEENWNLVQPLLHHQLNQRGTDVCRIIKDFLKYTFEEYQRDARDALATVMITAKTFFPSPGAKKNSFSTKSFFNRLGGLPVDIQQNIYEDFQETYNFFVEDAKANDNYEGEAGVISANSITLNPLKYEVAPVYAHSLSEVAHISEAGLSTSMVHLNVDKGVPWELALKMLKDSIVKAQQYADHSLKIQKDLGKWNGFYLWHPFADHSQGRFEVVLILEVPNLTRGYTLNTKHRLLRILTPHRGEAKSIGKVLGADTGKSGEGYAKLPTLHQLLLRTKRDDEMDRIFNPEEAKNRWQKQYEEGYTHCSQCRKCRQFKLGEKYIPSKRCVPCMQDPPRLSSVSIITGSVLQLWDVFENTILQSKSKVITEKYGHGVQGVSAKKHNILQLKKGKSLMNVVRATITDGLGKGRMVSGLMVPQGFDAVNIRKAFKAATTSCHKRRVDRARELEQKKAADRARESEKKKPP